MGALGGAATGFMPDTPTLPSGANPPVEMAPVNTPMEGVPPPAVTPPVTPPPPSSNMLGNANIFSPSGTLPSNAQLYTSAGINALGSMNTKPAGAYTPPNAIYTGGPLQKFKYDPNNYQPDVVTPPTPLYHAQYAQGGITSLAAGGNPGQFDTPLPNPQGYKLESTGRYDAIPSASDSSYFDSFPEIIAQALKESPANSLTMNVRPAYAAGGMASGGISTLGSYSDGGRLLKGPGDGMSDSIPAKIGGKQEARLADGEFVIPSDVVSGLGNGSTDAGAKHLYKMMDKVRHARTGRKSQGKQIKSEKYLPA